MSGLTHMLDELVSGTISIRSAVPPAPIHSSGSAFSAFRWQIENWYPAILRQKHFRFIDGTNFQVRTRPDPSSSYFEFVIKSIDPVGSQEWYVEATFRNAFDPQQSVVFYTPVSMLMPVQEAVIVSSVDLSDIDNFLFGNNTLVIDFRFSDEDFAGPSSSSITGPISQAAQDSVPFAGLMNNGNSSFMNCMLQILYHLPVFRALVYSVEHPSAVVLALQRLFGGMQDSSKTCSTRLLTKALASDKLPGEHDLIMYRESENFARILFDHLRVDGVDVMELFSVRWRTNSECLGVQCQVPDTDESDSLVFDVKMSSSLEDLFIQFVNKSFRMNDDQYDTEQFGRQDVSFTREFVHFPPILFIHLNRFETNPRTGRREKVADYLSFRCDLDLTKYISGTTEPYMYELFGVLVHMGSITSGQYVVFIKTSANDQWYKFNDSSVTLATLDDATLQNFGGAPARNAVMLVYVRRSEMRRVFQTVVLPERIRESVSEVKVRSLPALKKGSRSANTKTVQLFTDSDFRKAVLEGITAADLTDIPLSIEVDENDTNHDLYEKAAECLAASRGLIRIWKVGRYRLPTTAITDNTQKCSTKESILYVQVLSEEDTSFRKSMRVAFLSFFFPSATPKVQFIGSVTVSNTQPISQVFQFVYSVLQAPGVPLRVYCDSLMPIQPIQQNRPLIDLQLTESAHYILESSMGIPPPVSLGYFSPKPDDFVNYYSMLRPDGDSNVEQYLQRRMMQLFVNLYKVSDPFGKPVTVAAPEHLPVTELPRFILFATRARFDPKRDTLQIFRRKVNSEVNEVSPYVVREGVTLKSLFVSELKRGAKVSEMKLFYDIIEGYTPEQLKAVIIRTCEIYDTPAHPTQRIRIPMKHDAPITQIGDYIREHFQNYGPARYLLDENGLVRLIQPDESIDEHQLIRFDVIPEDQLHMAPGDLLVVIKVCRASKHRDNVMDLKQSFLFRVVPGEIVDATCQRIVTTQFTDPRLAPHLLFITPSGRILNGDECLHDFVKENDIVQVVLPDRARENNICRDNQEELLPN